MIHFSKCLTTVGQTREVKGGLLNKNCQAAKILHLYITIDRNENIGPFSEQFRFLSVASARLFSQFKYFIKLDHFASVNELFLFTLASRGIQDMVHPHDRNCWNVILQTNFFIGVRSTHLNRSYNFSIASTGLIFRLQQGSKHKLSQRI